MQETKTVNINRLWKAWAPALLVGLSILFTVSLIRNVALLMAGNAELARAESELNLKQQANQKLKERLAIVTTDQYKDKLTRDKLGLAKEGETVFIMPEEEVLRQLSPRIKKDEQHTLPDSNWRKWLKLFM